MDEFETNTCYSNMVSWESLHYSFKPTVTLRMIYSVTDVWAWFDHAPLVVDHVSSLFWYVAIRMLNYSCISSVKYPLYTSNIQDFATFDWTFIVNFTVCCVARCHLSLDCIQFNVSIGLLWSTLTCHCIP